MIKKIICALSAVFIVVSLMIPFVTFAEGEGAIAKVNIEVEPYFEMPDEITNQPILQQQIPYYFRQAVRYNFTLDSPYLFFNVRTGFPSSSDYNGHPFSDSTYFGIDLSAGYTIEFDENYLIFNLQHQSNVLNLQIMNRAYEYVNSDWRFSGRYSGTFGGFSGIPPIFSQYNLTTLYYNLSDSSIWATNENGDIVEFYLRPDLSEYYDTNLGSHVIVDHVTTNIDEITSSPFDVQVNFSPALSGEVDRSFLANGQTCYSQSLTMTVKNNSRTSIQYSMAIYRADDIYYDNPVFRYLSAGGFVYSSDLTNQQNYFNQVPRLFYKKSQWLYLAPHEQTVQVIKYSQLPLEQKKNYRVVVKAVATDFDYPTDFVMQEFDDVYSDLYQLPSATIVYNSVFSIKYLADCPYDYNDTSNGITPYKSNDDFQRAYYTYSQYADDNGVIQNGGFNLWDNPDSWVHHPNGTSTERSRFGDTSSDATSLIHQSNGVLQFFSCFLNFMPPEIRYILIAGVTAVVAVVILKFVRG